MNKTRACSKRTTRHHRSLRDYSLWAGIGTILQKSSMMFSGRLPQFHRACNPPPLWIKPDQKYVAANYHASFGKGKRSCSMKRLTLTHTNIRYLQSGFVLSRVFPLPIQGHGGAPSGLTVRGANFLYPPLPPKALFLTLPTRIHTMPPAASLATWSLS